MKKFLLIAALGMAVACGGSKGAEQTDGADAVKEQPAEPAAGPETAAENVLPNDGTRQVGDVTECPVSKDVFKISDKAPTVEHNGGTYYFCCKGCVEKFAADPDKYTSGGATEAHEAPADAPADAAPADAPAEG